MGIIVHYKDAVFMENIVDPFVSGRYDISDDQTFPYYITEDEYKLEDTYSELNLVSYTIEVTKKEEYGEEVLLFSRFRSTFPILAYEKQTGILHEHTSEVRYDDACVEFWLKVLAIENKYLYKRICQYAFENYNKMHFRKFVASCRALKKNDAFEKMESMVKVIGCVSLMLDDDLCKHVKNKKGLKNSVGVPLNVLQWIKSVYKKENLDKLNNLHLGNLIALFCEIGEEPNEAVYLKDYFQVLIQNKISQKDIVFPYIISFLETYLEIKKKCKDVTIQKLLPYLVKQELREKMITKERGYYSIPDKDLILEVLSVPSYTIREYRDYLHLVSEKDFGSKLDLYPDNLAQAHNIAHKNLNVVLDEEKKENFKKIVDLCRYLEQKSNENKYYIMVPEKIEDLIYEGTYLNHCVKYYADTVINQEELVFFLRKKEEPKVPFVTFATNCDLAILEVTGKNNEPVTDPEIFSFLKKWQQKNEGVKKVC